MSTVKNFALVAASSLMLALTISPVYAQQCDSTNRKNPEKATCDSQMTSTKLFANSTVMIYAQELSNWNDPNSTPVYQCHSIKSQRPSTSSLADFVPWNSVKEWTAFLKVAKNNVGNPSAPFVDAGGCCIPMLASDVKCKTPGGGVATYQISPALPLGYTHIGTFLDSTKTAPVTGNPIPTGIPAGAFTPTPTYPNGQYGYNDYGLDHWAANGSVPKGITAYSVDSKGNKVPFTAVFSCSTDLSINPAFGTNYDPSDLFNGFYGWELQHAPDICPASSGACNSSATSFSKSTPPVESSETLCATGSVIKVGSLQATATGWTWECDGTGGTGCGTDGKQACINAQCTASNSDVTAGCGFKTKNFTSTNPPVESKSLCATGNTIKVGSLTTTATGWTWECDGSGTSTKQCNALNIAQPACGDMWNNTIYSATDMAGFYADCLSGGTCSMCSSGKPDSYTDWDGSSSNWGWNCVTSPGQYTWCAAHSSNMKAQCGYDSYVNFSSGKPLSSTDWQLCSNYNADGSEANGSLVASNFKFTPDASGDGSGIYSWTCSQPQNSSNISTVDCSTGRSASTNANWYQGQCGYAANVPVPLPNPPSAGLCADNPLATLISSPTLNTDGNGDKYWQWACAGSDLTDPYSAVSCYAYAYKPTTPNPGQCSGTAGQCNYGTVTTYTCDANNNCTWACQGDAGTSPASCSSTGTTSTAGQCGTTLGSCIYGAASVQTCNSTSCTWSCQGDSGTASVGCSGAVSTPPITADGKCGSSNGFPTYLIPNVPAHLCSSGQPSVVTGTGPWNWTCLGTGSSTVNANCSAPVCSECTGQLTRTNSTTRTGTGTCSGSYKASWTEIDDLSSTDQNTGTISWTDNFGSFSFSVGAASAAGFSPSAGAPAYCQPCNMELNHVTNATMTLQGTSGTCPSTITPTNVTP